MAAQAEPKHPTLNRVFWREEILEVLLWLRGEGFDDGLDSDLLHRFLGIPEDAAAEHLHRLALHGYLAVREDGRHRLTREGEEEAARLLRGPRAMPARGSGPCGPRCWCATSPFEASRCAAYTVG